MEQKIGKTVPIVLIADDVEANRFMLKNIISEMGNQAVLAENGMQAVKLAQRMKPQLIILDIAMPEMDGYEACEKLKEDPDTRDIPIIFISFAGWSKYAAEMHAMAYLVSFTRITVTFCGASTFSSTISTFAPFSITSCTNL